jgi:hypothetical protein
MPAEHWKAAPAGFRLNFDRSAASFRADASTVKKLRWRIYPDKPYVFEKVVSEIIRCKPKITLQLLPNAIGNYFKLMEHDYVLRL